MGQLFISAAHKSSGKTIVSSALCAAFRAGNKIVQPFKKGPDYIDPMWLASAARRNCYNLDFWTQSEEEILQLFASKSAGADMAIIEANKGLYDGLDLRGADSNAALAKLLQSSVVLVLDCRGTIRGIAPLLLGYQQFDKAVNIQGVILNFVGGNRHEKKLRQVVAHYTDLAVFGAIWRHQALTLEERHLGLIPSNEDRRAKKKIQSLADIVAQQVDLPALANVASPVAGLTRTEHRTGEKSFQLKIAYAKDAAFGFYYADDMDTFRALGAILIPFDTLNDQQLPAADGLFIGGGFPEKFMPALEKNQTMRKQILRTLAAGLPAYAECGGLMYLCDSIHYQQASAAMVGLIKARCVMSSTPQGRGYIQFKQNQNNFWSQPCYAPINAHEFHYSRLEGLNAENIFTFDVVRGTGISNHKDGLRIHNTLACYAHQRHTRQNPWIEHFLNFVESSRKTLNKPVYAPDQNTQR